MLFLIDKPFWIPVPRFREDKFHGNDIFIHWAIVVIPAEAGIQYL